MYTPSTPHPHHPHHLECPRCSCRTVVIQGESRYICLNCGWEQDVNHSRQDPLANFLIAVLTIAFFLILVSLSSEGNPQDGSVEQGIGWEPGLVRAIASPRPGFDPLT